MTETLKNEDNLSNEIFGCGWAKEMMDLLEKNGFIHIEDTVLLEGHCAECEDCNQRYQEITKKRETV